MLRSLLCRGAAVLVVSAALAGCNTTSATPGSQASSPASSQSHLAPPAAPIGLTTDVLDPDLQPRTLNYTWTQPPGPITGYYIHSQPSGDDSVPVACKPSWTALAASATSWQSLWTDTEPFVYICAVNAAGTSPTAKFPRYSETHG